MILLVTAFLASMGPTLAILETAGDPDGWNSIVDPLDGFTLFNSLYFSVVTIATVGYGDITPITFLGRLFTTLFIIAGIALVGQLTSRLIEILSSVRPGGGAFLNPTRRYLTLIVGETSPAQLQDILGELFHSERYGVRQLLHALIMVEPRSFRSGLYKYFKAHPVYMHCVTYLRGSVFSRLDLIRAAADTPEMQAIFVVQRRFARSDTSNLLRVLALRRHLPHLPLYVMLAHSTNRHILEAAGIPEENILELDALRHGLLAINAITPGTAPILINLFSTDITPENPSTYRVHKFQNYFGKRLSRTTVPHLLTPFAPEGSVYSSSSTRSINLPRYGPAPEQSNIFTTTKSVGTLRSMFTRFRLAFQRKEGIEQKVEDDIGTTGEPLTEDSLDIDEAKNVPTVSEPLSESQIPQPVNLMTYPLVWQDEYGEGLGQEIYEITCPRWLIGHTYLSAVILIYCSRLLHTMAMKNLQHTNLQSDFHSKEKWSSFATARPWGFHHNSVSSLPASTKIPLTTPDNTSIPYSFTSIESLIDTLSPFLDQETIEGPVLIGIRHRSTRTGYTTLRCDMDRKYRLQEYDSLIIVARDISVIGEGILENITASLVAHVDENDKEVNYSPPDIRATAGQETSLDSQTTEQSLVIPSVPIVSTTHQPESSTTSTVSMLPGSTSAISARHIVSPLVLSEPPSDTSHLPTQESSAQRLSFTALPPLHRSRSVPYIGTESNQARIPSISRPITPYTPYHSKDSLRIGQIPAEGIHDHIVVITDGWLHSLRLFINPLRQVSTRPIVILSPSEPDDWLIKLMHEQYYYSSNSQMILSSTSTIPNTSLILRGAIYFVRGDPLLERDLRLAYVQTARRVVIFTGLPPEGFEGTSNWNVTTAIDEAISDISKLSKEKSVSESYVWATTGEEISQVSEALVDAVGILTTMVIEGRLSSIAPLLIYGITTEIALNRSVELLPGPATLRELGTYQPVRVSLRAVRRPEQIEEKIMESNEIMKKSAQSNDKDDIYSPPLSSLVDQRPVDADVNTTSMYRTSLPPPYSLYTLGSMTNIHHVSGAVSPVPIREISSLRKLPTESSNNQPVSPASQPSPPLVSSNSSLLQPEVSNIHPLIPPSYKIPTSTPMESGIDGYSSNLRWSIRYAGGRLFPTSCLNNLLVASFYNPSLLRMIHMFARGDKLRLRHVPIPASILHQSSCTLRYRNVASENEVLPSPRVTHSSATQPDNDSTTCYCQITYAKLFLHIVRKYHLVPLGLFRDRSWLNAPLPYIHSNPRMNARVRCGDVAFIVAPVQL